MAKIQIEDKRFLVDGIDIGDKVLIGLQVRNVERVKICGLLNNPC